MKKLMVFLAEFLLAIALLVGGVWFILVQPVWHFSSTPLVATPKADPVALHAMVHTLSAELPPRHGTEEALAPTVEWIEQQFRQYGEPQRQSYEVEDQQFHNIILKFGPETEELVVIGAHYDTDGGLPGADDNGSGVAGLIELARLLKDVELSMRVELVAFTLEEMPHFYNDINMGSYVHASQLYEAEKQVRLMISLEMIGYFSDEPGSQHYPVPLLDKIYPDKGNFIGIVSNLSNIFTVRKVKKYFLESADLPVWSINSPTLVPGIDWSDHKNYWSFGYPAVMVTDTAFARNLEYHTPKDTADRLDYDKMAEVVQATYHTVVSLAGKTAE